MTHGVCVCVCPVQAPSPSHRLPPGRRTLSREDTRTTRTTTAASWPTRPREDITTPRNTKTLSCKAGKAGSDIITDQNSSNFLSCRQFQTLFASLVVQKAWCPTHTNAHRYLWSTFATRRYRNCAQLMFQCKYSVGVCDLCFIFPPLFRDSVCAYRVSPSHSKTPNVWKDKKHKRNVNTSLEAISHSWRRHIFILPFWTEEKFMNLKHSNAN